MSALPAQRDPLALLEQGRQYLADAVDADDALKVRAVASAAEAYARQARLGREAENMAAELRVRAERRAGELLREAAATGERDNGRGNRNPDLKSRSATPKLADLGISKDESSRFQKLADVPEPVFEEVIAEKKETGERITSAGLRMAVHYSSQTDQWATPQDLFDTLHAEFGFTLDVCASAENAKCSAYFDEAEDGLKQPWTGTCWMNPPYGDAIPKWISKAHASSKQGATVVCLVPARTDTGWWWDHCRYAEIRFLRGRLKFGDGVNSAPFPNAIVVFGRPERVVWWEWR